MKQLPQKLVDTAEEIRRLQKEGKQVMYIPKRRAGVTLINQLVQAEDAEIIIQEAIPLTASEGK